MIDFRALFDAVSTPLMALSPVGWSLLAVNDAALREVGFTSDELLGRNIFDVVRDDPGDAETAAQQSLAASLDQALATRTEQTRIAQPFSVRAENGRSAKRCWTSVSTPVVGAQGEVVCILLRLDQVSTDIGLCGRDETVDRSVDEQTALIDRSRLAETHLGRANALLEAVMESVPGVVYAKDLQGRMLAANRGTAQLVGKPLTEILGRTDAEFLDDQVQAAAVMANDRRILEQERAEEIEEAVSGPNGESLIWLSTKAPFRDAQGKIIGLIGSSVDITIRKRIEQQLRDLNENLEEQVAIRTAELDRVWKNSRELLGVADLEGRWISVNPAWTRTLGWKEPDLLGRTSEWMEHSDDRKGTQAEIAQLVAGKQTLGFENRFRDRDGNFHWLSWTAVREGDLLFASARDVTAEKARQAELETAREALRQSQKMEAVGQLTGGIAHDFNNMLAVITVSLELLKKRLGHTDDGTRRYLDAAAAGARKAAALTQRLLAFARQQPLQPEMVDVNQLVAGMCELLKGSLGSAIRLETLLDRSTLFTHVDPNQLENVVLNLAVNARDAMPEGGELAIETRVVQLDDVSASLDSEADDGQHVLIAVTDSGMGMPDDVVEKAFEPFFTTKEVGKGTGLGLSQVYGFVKQSGGHVEIRSTPGRGTTVNIYLPRIVHGIVVPVAGPSASRALVSSRQETILVVEDEPAVRQFTVEALSSLGYRVLEAASAAAALMLLRAHQEVSLLLTDVVMPDLSGRQLADEVRESWPGVRIVFMTGFPRNKLDNDSMLNPGVELIGKPFTIEELDAKLRLALADLPARGA